MAKTLITLENLQRAMSKVKEAVEKGGTVFKGATSTADGTSGIVPIPKKGEQNYVLKADGTWTDVAATNEEIDTILKS